MSSDVVILTRRAMHGCFCGSQPPYDPAPPELSADQLQPVWVKQVGKDGKETAESAADRQRLEKELEPEEFRKISDSDLYRLEDWQEVQAQITGGSGSRLAAARSIHLCFGALSSQVLWLTATLFERMQGSIQSVASCSSC